MSASNHTGHTGPDHIAIIMDGNGRWAKARNLPRSAGHQAGAAVIEDIMVTAAEKGVGYLTLFSFSSENWHRPPREVEALMNLLRHYLKKEVMAFHQRGARLTVIGQRADLAPDIRDMIGEAEELTRKNNKIHLGIALNYGGQADIIQATRQLAEKVQAGYLKAGDIDESLFNQTLMTAGFPPPDLLIRSGGEKRISNFLLWQLAYSEIYFTDKLWPDFSARDFEDALVDYQNRQRRYGRVSED